MRIGGITTIDSEISFGECDIQEVPEKNKKALSGSEPGKGH